MGWPKVTVVGQYSAHAIHLLGARDKGNTPFLGAIVL